VEVRRIVTAAGALIEETRASGQFHTHSKDDSSPVTRADRAADELLGLQLRDVVPAAWPSEETADDAARLKIDRLCVVDPLDGTREFVEGPGAASLSHSSQPATRSGRGTQPGDRRHVLGAARWGAFRNGGTIRVVVGNELLTSRSKTRRGEFVPFEQRWQWKRLGSIQLKLELVAAGEAALTLSRGPKHEWDVCAGRLIVRGGGPPCHRHIRARSHIQTAISQGKRHSRWRTAGSRSRPRAAARQLARPTEWTSSPMSALRAPGARRSIHLDVILVIAGAFGLGAAMENTGLAEWLAGGLIQALTPLGPTGVLAGVLLATVALLAIITNKAETVLMFPIAMSAAAGHELDQRAFAIAVAVTASASFLTPIAYQTNLMVYGPGGYRFTDYVRLGAPLTLGVVVIILMPGTVS
jgi:fructose-1,6-bisphosphatase/inositol monophosphatase family enzyme